MTPRGDPAIELISEIEILKALQGTPGVVSLLDHLRQIEPPIMAAVFELLMGGDLFDRIETHGPCTEPEAAQIAQQVGGALAHMHSLKIVHRDIKPDNLAFASRDGAIEVKLIDFGSSTLERARNKRLDIVAIHLDRLSKLADRVFKLGEIEIDLADIKRDPVIFQVEILRKKKILKRDII